MPGLNGTGSCTMTVAKPDDSPGELAVTCAVNAILPTCDAVTAYFAIAVILPALIVVVSDAFTTPRSELLIWTWISWVALAGFPLWSVSATTSLPVHEVTVLAHATITVGCAISLSDRRGNAKTENVA